MSSAALIAVVASIAAVGFAAMGVIANVIVNTVNRGDDRLAAALNALTAKVDALAARLDQLEQNPLAGVASADDRDG